MAGSWSFEPATAAFAASAGAFPASAAATKAFSGPSLSRASWSWSVSVDDLEVRVDRGRREQLVPERVEVRVHVLLVALLVRLLHLGDVLHDLAGDPQQPRSAEADEPRVHGPRGELPLDARHRGPGVADRLCEAGVRRHLRAQGLLLSGLHRHRLRVEERRVVAPQRLLRVLVAEDLVEGAPLLLLAEARVRAQGGQPPLERLQAERQGLVAQVLQAGHRLEPRGRAGVPGDEHQVAVAHALRRPAEVRRGHDRLAALVGPHQADVEVVAGKGEVVGVAAEEGHRLLGGEDEPHVRVLPVLVELVLAALVEAHHVAAQLRARGALVLDRGGRGLARLARLGVGHLRLHRALHPARHVLHRGEDVDLVARARGLLLPRGRVEARLHEVVLGARHVLDAAEPHVVVRDHEAVGRDEGARAPVHESHRGEAHLVEPFLRRLEAVLRLQLRERRVVVGPHPLVGERRGRDEEDAAEQRGAGERGGHGWPLLRMRPS